MKQEMNNEVSEDQRDTKINNGLLSLIIVTCRRRDEQRDEQRERELKKIFDVSFVDFFPTTSSFSLCFCLMPSNVLRIRGKTLGVDTRVSLQLMQSSIFLIHNPFLSFN